jgi:hypothetical protein
MLRKLSLSALLGFAVVATGCGKSYKSVECIVTLDGKAVDGATVVFQPTEGSGKSASGFTDAEGKCSLSTGSKKGAMPGTYKVIVTKAEARTTGAVSPTSPEAMKEMQKTTKKGPGGPGMLGGAPGAAGKSLLPEKYGNGEKTPLTVKVPPDSSPVKLELTSK